MSGTFNTGQGMHPLKENLASLVQLAPHTDVTETRYIIGLASYHRIFIANFSDIVRPLDELTKKPSVSH